mgnify:CR=1 FL=1
MFISRHAFDELRADYIKANAIREALTVQVANLNAHLSWMQIRLTEMALERSAMMKRYLNIDVPVPTFEQPQDNPDLNQSVDFRDVGDKMAAELGIGWNADGTLSYSEK